MREFTKAWAFFKRDLRTDLSYRFSFVLQILNIVTTLAAFYFLTLVLGEKAFAGYQAFPFILTGMAVHGYMTTSLYAYAQGIRGNQQAGTLKVVLLSRTSPLAFIFLSSLYPFFRAAVDGGCYMAAGLLFGVSLTHMNLSAALVVFLASLPALSSIGIASAAFTLVFKRGDPLLWLVGGLSWLLGGVFYPQDVLPPVLQQAALFLPITHVLRGMRAALLQGVSLADLSPQIGALALFGAVALPLSLLGFCLGVRQARISGTLSHL